MTNNISFKSTIRPIMGKEFAKRAAAIGERNFVNQPWTIKESVIAKDAVTTGVFDCSVLGITDGVKVLLLHLCPDEPLNDNFGEIKNYIANFINNSTQNLNAILLGSQKISKKSTKLFNNLENFISEQKIPCSILKNCLDYFDVLYRKENDEWCISSVLTELCLIAGNRSNEEILDKAFKEIRLSSEDKIG